MKIARLTPTLVVLYLCYGSEIVLGALPALDWIPDETIPAVFSGEGRSVRAVLSNTIPTEVSLELRTRLLQMTSTTAAPIGGVQLQHRSRVPPRQTVIESITQKFPDVRTPTRFLVQWMDQDNVILARTEVLVYPPDPLNELKPLTGSTPIGLFDPGGTIRSRLTALRIGYIDLEKNGWEEFGGKLIIIGAFGQKDSVLEDFHGIIEREAKKGLSIVWIQPSTRMPRIEPLTYTLRVGKGVVVVVENRAVADLENNPVSQINLVRLARLALAPDELHFPNRKNLN